MNHHQILRVGVTLVFLLAIRGPCPSVAQEDADSEFNKAVDEVKAVAARLELEGDDLPKGLREFLETESAILLEIGREHRQERLPIQVEARHARERGGRIEVATHRLKNQREHARSSPEVGDQLEEQAKGLRIEVAAFRDYLDHDLNPRILDYNRQLIARCRRLTRVADAGFSGDEQRLGREVRDLRAAIEGRIRDLELIKDRERMAIRRIGDHVPQTIRAIEDWGKLANKARDDARRTARDFMVSFVLLDRRIHFAAQAEQARAPLDELGATMFKGTPDAQVRENYAKLLEEFRVARSKTELVELLQNSRNLYAVVSALSEEDRNAFILSVAKCFVRDPRLQLMLNDIELVSAIGYARVSGAVAEHEVDRLVNLSESDIRQIGSYSRMMHRTVNELSALRQEESRFASVGQ